jgi:histidyl-tRNA synthetase
MQPRGTNVYRGEEAKAIRETEATLRAIAISQGYEEIILPNFWGLETFTKRAGGKLTNTMYTFKDKADRDMVLVPEATAMITEMYDAGWDRSEKKPIKLFYLQRCYRYDRPQAGRYREFLQFGAEVLGGPSNFEDSLVLANYLVDYFRLKVKKNDSPERGLHYYNGRTYEFECEALGAQKQLFGGGEYPQGAGFAIGVERLIMARKASAT